MMKKLLLSLTIVLFVFSFAKAQDPLSLSWEGNPIGDTITIWGDPSNIDVIIYFYANVKNNTDRDMVVKAYRNEQSIVDNSENSFCWAGLCFPPSVDTSSTVDTIAAGASSADYNFSGDYLPKGNVGTSIIEYVFYNISNADENVKVVVKYWASPESIAEDAMQGGSISEIYPNPATNFINLDFDLTPSVEQAKVRVINLLGSVVKEVEIERGTNQLRLDISDLENGVYFYSVLINGDAYKTKKLIIR